MNHIAPGKQNIDVRSWPRLEHLQFFSAFEEPYWASPSPSTARPLTAYVKQHGISFHFYCLYQSLSAAQQVEASAPASKPTPSSSTTASTPAPSSTAPAKPLDTATFRTTPTSTNFSAPPRSNPTASAPPPASRALPPTTLSATPSSPGSTSPRFITPAPFPARIAAPHHLRPEDRARRSPSHACLHPRQPRRRRWPATRPVYRAVSKLNELSLDRYILHPGSTLTRKHVQWFPGATPP